MKIFTHIKSFLLLMCLLVGVGTSWGADPVKCTTTSDLVVGGVYYISGADTYSSTATVMGVSTGGNNFPVSTFGATPCELTLGGDATNGWTLSYVDGSTTYYLDPTSTTSSNHLKRSTSVTDYGKFSISFSNGVVVITSKGKKSRNIIRYNSSSSCYSCYSSGQGDVYLYKKVTTPSVAYTVTFNAGSNGTCSTTSLTESSAGAGVTLPSVTPNSGYRFKGWSTTEATYTAATLTAGVFKPTSNCTLYAFYDREYTAKFYVNGAQSGATQNLIQGETIVFPANPEVDGVAFMGWTKTADYSNATTAPSDLCKEATMGNADVTYYAVFADVEVGEDIPTTFYYEPFTGSAHSSGFASDNIAATQSMFYDKSAAVWSHYTSTGSPSTTSYATNLDGTNMSNGVKIYKQINNTTSTILEVKGIDIRNAKNLNVSLYNRRTYTNATLIVQYKIDDAENYTNTGGTIVYNSTNDNWKYSDGLTISGTGSTIDLKISVKVTGTTNRIMVIDDIKIYGILSGITYSNYCTTVVAPTTTINITTPEGYSTFVSEDAIVMPEGVQGSTATVAGGELTLAWEYQAGTTVPANTPILVKGTEGEHTANTTTGGDAPATNYFVANTTGAAEDAYILAEDIDAKCYVLSYDKGGQNLGFYWFTETGDGDFKVPAGKVFLAVPASVSGAKSFVLEGVTTGVNAIETVNNNNKVAYNLAGQRVAANTKGIVIINGKKYIK